ncbi:MAG: methyltransferase domain-containing protein [Anaerolineales bacterium]|nr:methyltransferase domain-containing protein [Anaerolineales bacterium]
MNHPYQLEFDTVMKASRESLARFENIHRGERAVIIGNGPSLNRMDLSFLKNEFTFGMNRIYLGFEKWGFTPSYYVSVNPLVIEQSMESIRGIDTPRFLSTRAFDFMKEPDEAILLTSLDAPYFSRDPREGLWEGYTVTYVALQLAYYMGFERIFLIGVDHHFSAPGEPNQEITSDGKDINHFHPNYFGKGTRWHLPDLTNSEFSYRLARNAFEADGREVLDATLGGKLTIFPKVDYANVFLRSMRTQIDALDLHEPPLVSAVVLPSASPVDHNRIVGDLHEQTYRKTEIILPGVSETGDALNPARDDITVVDVEGLTQAEALARLIAAARGAYIALLSPDARYHRDHLSILEGKLSSHPTYPIGYAQTKKHRQMGNADVEGYAFEAGVDCTRSDLLVSNPITNGAMFRKQAFLAAGGLDSDLGELALWDLWLRMAEASPIAFIATITTHTREQARKAILDEELTALRAFYDTYTHATTPAIRERQERHLHALAPDRVLSPDDPQRFWSDHVSELVSAADVAINDKDFNRGLSLLESALTEAPDDAFLRNAHGNLALLMGNITAARADFVHACACHPDHAASFAGLGMTLIQIGEIETGIEALQRAQELDPDNSTARTILAQIELPPVCTGYDPSLPTEGGSKNLENLARTWNDFGSMDPMWAILTRADKKGNRWEPGEFFETGIRDIRILLGYLDGLKLDVQRGTALDFGCGIGRLTQALAMEFEEVHGVDIAASMIERARMFNRFSERCSYHVNPSNNLKLLDGVAFNLIYSVITLQHIRPEITRGYLLEFMRLLAPRGILVFQLPAEKRDPDAARHDRARLAQEVVYDSDNLIMEMNGIPKSEVVKILESAGGRIKDIQDDASLGQDWYSYRYCAVKE